jgi:diguanylate cyclase (GGDEF)-like protein/PAS domain S-box-containing protein
MFDSVRTRLNAIIIALATLPVLGLGLLAGDRSAAELEKQSLALQRAVALRVEREIAAFIHARVNDLQLLDRIEAITRLTAAEVTALLGRLLGHQRAYHQLALVTPTAAEASVVSRTGTPDLVRVDDFLRSDAAKPLWQNAGVHIGAIRYDATLREPLLDLALPIEDRHSGRVAAVLLAQVRIKGLWDLLATLELPDQARALLVDDAGRILADRTPATVLAGATFERPRQDGRHVLADGESVLVASRSLAGVDAPAHVIVTRSLDSALAVASKTRATTLTTAVAMLLAAAALALLLARQIVRPVEGLARAAQGIGDGDLETEIPTAGPREVRELAMTLRTMTRHLAGTIASLEDSEFAARERAMVTLESIGDAVITTDQDGRVSYLNPVAEQMTGWSLKEARDQPVTRVFDIVNEHTRKPAPDPIARCLAEGRVVGLANHTVLISRDGREYAIQDSAAPIRARDGGMLGVVMVFSDVTAARALQREISHQATHDSLTGLVNRREFEHRLERVLETTRRDGSEHVLCYLDLDQFKIINDTCGHAAGDELLCQLAVTLQSLVRRRDTLGRLGGDEFGILMEHCSAEQGTRVAENMRAGVETLRFSWDEKVFRVGVSIGIVPINGLHATVHAVLSAADNACYLAKDAGRNRVHVYQEDDTEIAQRRDEMRWVGILTRALEEGRFELHAQPISSLRSSDEPGRHVELLLRLVSESGERILPGRFLPAAERYDLITRIDRWVVGTAVAWLGRQEPSGDLYSINISGASLGDTEFLDFVLELLDDSGVVGEQLCFELTETAAIRNLGMATRFMHTVGRRGCRFALDDFGSGLSSFAYLKSLPVQFLKIDGGFVKDMATSPLDFAIVRSIVDVGQALGMRTIAEFVEDAAVLQKLGELEVDAAQGFEIGRPEPLIVAAPANDGGDDSSPGQ